MNTNRVVIDLPVDSLMVHPSMTDMRYLESDLDRIFAAIPRKRLGSLVNEMSRVEILARIAYGSYHFLENLGHALAIQQTNAGASLMEIAKWLTTLYPIKPDLRLADDLGGVTIHGATSSPPPSEGGGM